MRLSAASTMDTERMGSEDWAELQRNLEATIPVYDRINRFATFGQDKRWRKMVRSRLPSEGKILEVGCGPGTFAEMIPDRDLTCLDQFLPCFRLLKRGSILSGNTCGIC